VNASEIISARTGCATARTQWLRALANAVENMVMRGASDSFVAVWPLPGGCTTTLTCGFDFQHGNVLSHIPKCAVFEHGTVTRTDGRIAALLNTPPP